MDPALFQITQNPASAGFFFRGQSRIFPKLEKYDSDPDRHNPDRHNPDRHNPDRHNPDRHNPDRHNPDRHKR